MEEEASKSLIIEQDNKNYLLVMKFQKEKLNLNLSVQEEVLYKKYDYKRN